ncbi:hypothetical protein AVEN_129962-1, partial [Araneus ventricosus]
MRKTTPDPASLSKLPRPTNWKVIGPLRTVYVHQAHIHGESSVESGHEPSTTGSEAEILLGISGSAKIT